MALDTLYTSRNDVRGKNSYLNTYTVMQTLFLAELKTYVSIIFSASQRSACPLLIILIQSVLAVCICSYHDWAMVCENYQLKKAIRKGRPYEAKLVSIFCL